MAKSCPSAQYVPPIRPIHMAVSQSTLQQQRPCCHVAVRVVHVLRPSVSRRRAIRDLTPVRNAEPIAAIPTEFAKLRLSRIEFWEMTPTKLVSVVIAIVFETPVSLPANHVDFKPPSLCLSYRTFSSFCERACELGRHFLGQFLSSAKLRFKEGRKEGRSVVRARW